MLYAIDLAIILIGVGLSLYQKKYRGPHESPHSIADSPSMAIALSFIKATVFIWAFANLLLMARYDLYIHAYEAMLGLAVIQLLTTGCAYGYVKSNFLGGIFAADYRKYRDLKKAAQERLEQAAKRKAEAMKNPNLRGLLEAEQE